MEQQQAQQLIYMVEQDLKQIAEAEINRFRDRYSECKKVDSIYLDEHLSVGIYDIQLHGLTCNHYLNIFVTNDRLYEFPEFGCFVEFEEKEKNFKRTLAYIMLLYTPVTNMCFIKAELHEYEIREAAEHIIKIAEEEEMEGES